MRTPTEWTKFINEGIITEEMLEAATYSYNKRAKNCRDQRRSYSHSRYTYASTVQDKYEEQESEYYHKKERLLEYALPICIHKERIGYVKTRVYDYDKAFDDKLVSALFGGRIVWTNCYYDYREYDDDYYNDIYTEPPGRQVYFFDEVDFDRPLYNYYLYYIIGTHGFHNPISENDLEKYKNIPVYEINRIVTDGKDITDLCSVQFADKVLSLLESGKAEKRLSCDNPFLIGDLREIEFDKIECNQRNTIESEQSKNIENAMCEWGCYVAEKIQKDFESRYTKEIDSELYDSELNEFQITIQNNLNVLTTEINNTVQNVTNTISRATKIKELNRARKVLNKADGRINNFTSKQRNSFNISSNVFWDFVNDLIWCEGCEYDHSAISVYSVSELTNIYIEQNTDDFELIQKKDSVITKTCSQALKLLKNRITNTQKDLSRKINEIKQQQKEVTRKEFP